MGEDERRAGRSAQPGASDPTEAGSVRREQVVTLAEEHASISTRVVEDAMVRVSTRTESVDHIEQAELGIERIEIERRPVNAWIDAMPALREEGDLTILPVVEERLVVEKRLFLTEEVHIRRVRSTEKVDLPVTLRRQYAVVERMDAEGRSELDSEPEKRSDRNTK